MPKIDRKNELRFGRDRKAQERLRAELDALREKRQTQIGPAEFKPQQPASKVRPVPGTANPTQPTLARTPAPRSSSRGIDLDFGTGPVGPFFLLAAAWLHRKRKQRG